MRKLKQAYVVDILRRLNLPNRGAYRIGKRFGVTARRVRQLREEYLRTGDVPRLRKPGPCREEVPLELKEIIMKEWNENPLGAVSLEKIIMKKHSIRISHNRIQEVLEEAGCSTPNPNKSRRRKWVRFERRHSNSLWQIDWTKLEGSWVVAIMDDASRFIVGFGRFPSATAEHSVEVLERAVAQYGKPRQLLSGHDAQFIPTVKDAEREKHAFQSALKAYRIKHILARISHPQTCGKVERFFGELKRKWKHFGSVEKFIDWYNNRRPHMSLDWENCETPARAFLKRQPGKRKIEVLVVR